MQFLVVLQIRFDVFFADRRPLQCHDIEQTLAFFLRRGDGEARRGAFERLPDEQRIQYLLPIELGDGIFVPRDAINVGNGDAGPRQAPSERMTRQRGIVLDAREPFFLHGRDEAAADEHAARRIVEMRRDADYDRIRHSIL